MQARAPSIQESEAVGAVRDSTDVRLDRERFVAAVERGIADVEAGRVIDDEELGRELDEEFGPLV